MSTGTGTAREHGTTDILDKLTAEIEPFDSFWEAPSDIEKGYSSFYKFYRHNYLPHFPERRDARILVVSAGYGYMLDMLRRHGYSDVLGIDSDPEKVRHTTGKGFNIKEAGGARFLTDNDTPYDVIFCEQEINHLTKAEILAYLPLLRENLAPGGTLIIHGLNGANPITGAEAFAQNFDHYNTFTEYTMKQVLEHTGFRDVKVFPLKLYVFFKNPLNYVLMAVAGIFELFFKAAFVMYGKKNRIFTKKIGASCQR